MKHQIEDKGNGRKDAKIGNPRSDDSRAEINKSKVLPSDSNGQMPNLTNCMTNALRRGHLWRCFEHNIDEAETNG